MKKRYVYFVSVWNNAVHSEVHNMEIVLDEPVTTIKQVREMQNKARSIVLVSPCCRIINYQLLREETEPEQERECPAKV